MAVEPNAISILLKLQSSSRKAGCSTRHVQADKQDQNSDRELMSSLWWSARKRSQPLAPETISADVALLFASAPHFGTPRTRGQRALGPCLKPECSNSPSTSRAPKQPANYRPRHVLQNAPLSLSANCHILMVRVVVKYSSTCFSDSV